MSELKSYINRVLGNSLRCLLPSYWWKRLFGLVVDRIDGVESTLSTSIDEAKRDVEIPILESEEELENLNVPIGKLATVIGKGRSFRECYWPTEFPENGDDIFPLLTHIQNINVLEGPITSTIIMALQASNNGGVAKIIQLVVDNDQQLVGAVDGVTGRVYILSRNGQVYADVLQELNDLLASDVYRYIARGGNDNLTEDEFDALDKLIRWDVSSDAYIKGGSWERLIKERDLGSPTGSVVFYTPVLGDLTEEQKMKNREAYQKVVDAKGIIDIKLNFLLLLQTPSLISFDSSNNIVLALVATTGGSKYIVSPDGNVTVESIEIPEANGGVEIRELRLKDSLSDDDKAYNLKTVELYKEGKALVIVPIGYSQTSTERTDRMMAPFFVDLHTGDSTKLATFRFLNPLMDETDPFDKGFIRETTVVISNDGSVSWTERSFYDVAMSDTSTRAVLNKVVKEYVDLNRLDIEANIKENEKITAAALVDLNTKIESILTRLNIAGI